MSGSADADVDGRRNRREQRVRHAERAAEIDRVLQCCDDLDRPGSAEARLLLSGLAAPYRRLGEELSSGSQHHRWYYHLTGSQWDGDWAAWRQALQARWDESRPAVRGRSGRGGRGVGRGLSGPAVHSGTPHSRVRGALDTLEREGVVPGSELARQRLRGLIPRFDARRMGDRASLPYRWHVMVTGRPPPVDAVGYARARRTERMWRARDAAAGAATHGLEDSGDGMSVDMLDLSPVPSMRGWSGDEGSPHGSWQASEDGDAEQEEGECWLAAAPCVAAAAVLVLRAAVSARLLLLLRVAADLCGRRAHVCSSGCWRAVYAAAALFGVAAVVLACLCVVIGPDAV